MFYPMQYRRVVLGLIIAFVDLRIGGVDILPDFAGYILISMGLAELSNQNKYFGIAEHYSTALILISIFQVYDVKNRSFLNLIPADFGIGYSVYISAVICIKAVMVYFMCRAIKELTENRELSGLHKCAGIVYDAYFLANVFFLIAMVFKLTLYYTYAAQVAYAIELIFMVFFIYSAVKLSHYK